jgi:hypothetical protein
MRVACSVDQNTCNSLLIRLGLPILLDQDQLNFRKNTEKLAPLLLEFHELLLQLKQTESTQFRNLSWRTDFAAA